MLLHTFIHSILLIEVPFEVIRAHSVTDLKPENLVFASDDLNSEIKLVDFGFAKKCSSNSGMSTPIGTLGYKAPEVLMHQNYDKSVDMWSLGVISYILLCGFPPFFSNAEFKQNFSLLSSAPFWYFFNSSTDELQREILQGQVDFPEPFWKDISEDAKDFILGLLQVDASKRMSAEEALKHPWMTRYSLQHFTEPSDLHVQFLDPLRELDNRKNIDKPIQPGSEARHTPPESSYTATTTGTWYSEVATESSTKLACNPGLLDTCWKT